MIKNIGIHIKVSDFQKSVAFYKCLGFKSVFDYGPDKVVHESYSGIVFECGGAKLEIANGHRAVKDYVFKEKVLSSKLSLMIGVNNISRIIGRASKNNIELAVGPRHYYWGTLEVVIKDPDGAVLVFVSPYTRNEAKKINADEAFGNPPCS